MSRRLLGLGRLLRNVFERVTGGLLGLLLLRLRGPGRRGLLLRRRRLRCQREAESADPDGRHQQACAPDELHADIPFHSALREKLRFTEDS